MIRVGFVLEFDDAWQGGANYFRNLLQAVYALPERGIEPVIFLGKRSGAVKTAGLPPFAVVRSSMLDRHAIPWWARKILLKLFRRDFLLEQLLRRSCIHVLSHSASLGKGSRLPCLCWMADFQHKHMPQFFSEREIRQRDATIRAWGESCSVIILSSYDAKKDLQMFYPECRARLEVLQFVSAVAQKSPSTGREDVAKNYVVPDKYFLVANQFWAHKNHKVLLDALKHLKASGRDVLIVATGNTQDYRQPDYYARLMADAQPAGVAGNFSVAGLVPMEHLAILMQRAVAIINPSLFEGWNTAVEEAKSLGKQIILSDIPVHREQHPERAEYFQPHDAAGLAETLWKHWCSYDPDHDQAEMQNAATDFLGRRQEFAAQYQRIILDECARKGAPAITGGQ